MTDGEEEGRRMLREPKIRAKLSRYYQQFMETGELDENIHPWVKESWLESKALGIEPHRLGDLDRLSRADTLQLVEKHRSAINYLSHITKSLEEFLEKYKLSLLLLDKDARILHNYNSEFFRLGRTSLVGASLAMRQIGTSSVSIALKHRTTFWLFGPEMWVAACHKGDAGSTVVEIGDEVRYVLTLASNSKVNTPPDAAMSLLMLLRDSLRNHLELAERESSMRIILDATPMAMYEIAPDGNLLYANELGLSRMINIGVSGADLAAQKEVNLASYILNYQHTPIADGFSGEASYNQAVTWITHNQTYEDITTVVPVKHAGKVQSVVVASMPIEDLRMLVAHAAGFTAKYTLASLVTKGELFKAVRLRAARLAKGGSHILLQGESGVGKQRMAHGIHLASSRLAGPFISVRCTDHSPELLEQELFGSGGVDKGHQGKLELSHGGTLFIDEIEKMPVEIGERLAEALEQATLCRVGERLERKLDVRLVAAADTDIKRLTDRGYFSKRLYTLLSRRLIRVPALRARKEDLALLADNILLELATQHQLAKKELTEAAVAKLMGYNWPGNIKQLQMALEHAFFSTAGETIDADDVQLLGNDPIDKSWKKDRNAFMRFWKAAGGNVSRLANLLGVSRVTLYRYLRKYDMAKTETEE